MNSPKWDNEIKNATKNALNETNIPLPDKEEIWNRIQIELKKEQEVQMKKNNLKKYSGLIAASIILIVFLSSPTGSSAFSSVVHVVNQWKDNVVQFVVQTDHTDEGAALTPAPGEEFMLDENEQEAILTESQIKEVDLDEGKAMVKFDALFPIEDKLLGSYELQKVRVWTNSQETSAEKIELAYSDGEFWFSILQEKIPEHFSRSIEYNLDQAEVSEVMIGHFPATVVVSNNITNLEYILGNNYITIFGALSEDEAINVANQLKE
ncbi:DUF4367 domain-containing protein [Alkalihalobacterium chitinilyticum]|uniref:DUF4367 domain-containing protein n=1 Tax=Alkalihalobacterium chitinilyticum TaxID=2980103 RepID=A0ABT5VJ40_9BACI|nr:DUF4367 domain-containing protein [Alkalihalobacterium chitinilyticum]MDE5414463.1 DUF4367 domain-containing protein [Alkalihalobacterium chitinilyticum]